MYERYACLRNERGLTDYRVSKDTGMSPQVLTRWKQGKTRPSLRSLERIAKYLGIGVAELFIDG